MLWYKECRAHVCVGSVPQSQGICFTDSSTIASTSGVESEHILRIPQGCMEYNLSGLRNKTKTFVYTCMCGHVQYVEVRGQPQDKCCSSSIIHLFCRTLAQVKLDCSVSLGVCCLYLPSPGVTSVCYHAQIFSEFRELNSGLHGCQSSTK